MGKTSMALNILLNAGKKSGKNVAFFSLEMSREQLALRLISASASWTTRSWSPASCPSRTGRAWPAAADSLNRSTILIDDDSSVTVADINAKCRRVDNLGLVIIDYLQLMQSAGGKSRGNENRQQIVSDISRSLKIMAKELNVPVLCLSQLSRANESRQDKRPMLSDLRESGAIEQTPTSSCSSTGRGTITGTPRTPIWPSASSPKNRHGETGMVELQWQPEFTTFNDLEWQREE